MEKLITQNECIKTSDLSSDIENKSIINTNTDNIRNWNWNTDQTQNPMHQKKQLYPNIKIIKKKKIRKKITKNIASWWFIQLKNKYISLKNIKNIFWLSASRIDWWEMNQKIKIYNFNWEKFLHLDKNWIEKIILSLTHWNTSWSNFLKFKNSEIKNEFRKFLKLIFDIKNYSYSQK